jgi:hypothetical protein
MGLITAVFSFFDTVQRGMYQKHFTAVINSMAYKASVFVQASKK